MEMNQHLDQLCKDNQVEEEEEGLMVKSGKGRLIKSEPGNEEGIQEQNQSLG
jgi:hypothetical protein